MFQSVTVFDEDFTDDDMAAALDWQNEKRNICSCGEPFDESTALGADENYVGELVVCHACAAMDVTEREFRGRPHPVTDGLKRRVRRVED